MKTLTFSIKITPEDKSTIKQLVDGYSMDYRKMYNNLDLIKDKSFLDSLTTKSKKHLEYLTKEVIAFNDRNIANKNRILGNINDLTNKGSLTHKDNKRLIRLKQSYNKKIVFGSTKELIALSKGNGDTDVWRESRRIPMSFYGETARNGNRFFDFKGLSEGKILFKLEGSKTKINIGFNPKKYKELIQLEVLALNKQIPLTVKLTHNKLWITYDESILHNTKADIKPFYKEIKHVEDKDERKVLIKDFYTRHENRLKDGKLDRYIGLDLNPDGIGYSVVDKDMNIITKGYYDLNKIGKKKVSADKRKYEISIVIKRIFGIIKHFKVHSIVLEDLDIKPQDYGNKVSNRKINNIWNRLLIKQLIDRRCNESGTLLVMINPAYSSFIGNLLHNEYDPIASSLEVVRRGINKYSKGGFYPELNTTYFINDKMYDEIKECSTWKDMYSLFVTSKRSYRRKLKEFSFIGYNISSGSSMLRDVRFPYVSIF